MSVRPLTASVIAALSEEVVRPALFFEGEFASGTVNLWTGLEDVTWDGKTWTGRGGLVGVSEIAEEGDLVAGSVTVQLNGVDPSTLGLVVSEAEQERPGRIWLGFRDADGAVIPDPVRIFTGRLSVPNIDDSATNASVAITYENVAADLTRPREWRYTKESQAILHPGDRGFDFVTSIQERELTWGR